MNQYEKKITRLSNKVQILEEMLEESSRETYLESQRRSALNSLLHLSLREPALDELLESSLEILLAVDFLSVENKGCVFLARQNNILTLTAQQNFDDVQMQRCREVPFGTCVCGAAALREETIICASNDPLHEKSFEGVPNHGHCCLPLKSNDQLIGVLCLYIPANTDITKEQLDFLTNAAHIMAGTIQRHHYREKIAAYQADLEEMVDAKIKELRQAETSYRDMFNNSPSGIYQVNPDGKFISCNPALAKMLGYRSPKDLMAGVSDIATQIYADPRQRSILLERLEDGPVDNFITKLIRRDGKYIWGQISSRMATERGNRFIEGNILDITKRREAELALEAEKERLLITLRSIGDGVISTDAQGNIVMLNKIAENLTGWSQVEAEGQPLTNVFHIINEKTRALCVNPVEKVLQSGMIVGLANHTALIAKDGRERIIADSGAPIRDRNSEIIGVVLVFRDVTKTHKMEEELRRKRQLESLGVLAGGIAHDFNNILTAILGNINLAEYIIKDDEKAVKLLGQADKASRRAAALVQQLLTFSKGGDPVKAAASLVEIIQGTTDFIMRGSNIGCEYDFADDASLADIDSGQISQVIQNLVINAKQSMPGGGTITIGCHNFQKTDNDNLPLKKGNYLLVTVQDEGSGISSARLNNIFDPYFTTKKTGSGLGLAIVHSIVDKHGGYISVSSKLGSGTIFSFYLPATDKSLSLPVNEIDTAEGKGKGTILIMDDDEMVRDATSQMLDILGYKTVQVGTGQEAVAQYQAASKAGNPFRAVIMDLTIAGGMGGKEAVRQVLQHNPVAKVLVVSGYGNEPILANPKAYGFAGSLVKPFAMNELAQALNSILSD